MRATLAFLTLAALPLCAQPRVPRQVLAFYYDWYGNPQTSGRWVHWKDVNAAAKTIGGSTHFPALGAYDSHDPRVVTTHCRQAKDAGMTGFIVTWWAQGDFHDQGMPLILAAAQKAGLKITVYYETAPPRNAPSVEGAVKDLRYILDRYGKHPAWLTVRNKPVIFIYGRALGQLKLDGWREVKRQVADAVLLGDQISENAARVFDGIHTYNPTGRIAGRSVDEIRTWARENYPDWVKKAGAGIACVTIIPGYDDTHLDRKAPRPTTERHGGQTYRVLWEEAIAARPDWVLITSWNEWHEGSEIEPSAENGGRELRATRRYAPAFLRK